MRPGRHPVVEEDLRTLLADALPWERLAGKTLLISGAAGLVGGYVTEAVLYRNEVLPGPPCTVVALVRDRTSAAARFAHHGSRADLQFLVQPVEQPVPPGIRADFIIHAAGNATPRLFGVDPVGTYHGALLGTHHLLSLAQRSGSEGFLLLSSGAVHGVVAGEHTIIDERVIGVVDPLDPYACYAESKRMAETMCASWARQYGVAARIARLSHTYGPGLRRDDDRAFAQFVHAIVERRNIVLRTDGAAVRPYCYLSDAVAALLRILLQGRSGEAYLLANETAAASVIELARLLVSLYPDRGSQVRMLGESGTASVANRDPYHQLDTSKLRALGWSPRVDIRTGFQRTLQSLL
jgi:nucleoside-diphosphate-sugar epimerase